MSLLKGEKNVTDQRFGTFKRRLDVFIVLVAKWDKAHEYICDVFDLCNSYDNNKVESFDAFDLNTFFQRAFVEILAEQKRDHKKINQITQSLIKNIGSANFTDPFDDTLGDFERLLLVDLQYKVISTDNLDCYCRFFTVFPNFNFRKAASDPKFYGQLFKLFNGLWGFEHHDQVPNHSPYSSTTKKTPLRS